VLLQSRAFDAPKDAGILSAALVDAGGDPTVVAGLLLQCATPDELALPTDAIVAALAQLKVDRLAKHAAKG
jgi:hypothetical protein